MTGQILSRCTGWRVAWFVLLLSGCMLTRLQAQQQTNRPPPFLGSNANYNINATSSNRMVQISTNATDAGDDNLVWSHSGRYIAVDRSDPTATNQINQLRGPKYICVLDVGNMGNIQTIGPRTSANTNPVYPNITEWTWDDRRVLFGFWPTNIDPRCSLMSCSATGAASVADFLRDPTPPPNNLHVFSPSVIFDPTVNKERLLFLTATGPGIYPGLDTSTVNVWTVTYNAGEIPNWTNKVQLTAFTTTNKFQSVRWCPELGTNYQQLIDRYAIVKSKTVGKEIIVFNGVRGILSLADPVVTNLNDGRLSYRDGNASGGSQVTWTYDGVNLMYSKDQGATSEIYTVRSAGTNFTSAIFPTPSEFNEQNKQWLCINPAGTRVAFTVNKRIYMLPLVFSNAAVTNAGTTNILSDGGYTRAIIPSSALTSDVSFTITEPNSVDTNQFSGNYMSGAREFSAEGSSNGFSFNTNIEMYLQYTESDLPTNVSPTNLSIYLYNSTNTGAGGTTGTWSKISSMVDTNNAYVISTNITHFSIYALGNGAFPGAPGNVSASQGTYSNLVRVTWDASVGASSYIVWINSVSSTSSAAIAVSGVSTTRWDDTNGGILAATFYWVQATNDDGAGELSSPAASGWRTMKPFISMLGTNGSAIASGEAASAAKGTDLGSISWGSAVTNALAITNSGTAALTINGWTTNGAGAGHFRAVGIPATVSVNSVSNFSVIFSPSAAGSHTAAVSIANNSSNVASYLVYLAGTAVKRDQTISFPAIPDQVQTSQVTLTATASSGLPVSFSVASGSAVIGAGNVVSFSGAGVVSITASQAGNGNWNAAANVVNTFNVTAVTSNLGIPQNVSASDGAFTGLVVVTWSAVDGAAGYEIWNSEINNIGTASTVGRSSTTTYNDTSAGARAGLMKYYWLRAWNTVTTGAFSAVDSGYALPEAGAEIISGQPAIGDYDGDQKADPAVYHLNSGRLYAWISSAYYSLLEPAIQFHVESGEIPAFGDYDGDGYIDPGVFRAPAGTWYVWLSSAGYAQVGPILFGVDANDIPVAADYDGDHKTDPGVFHGAEGAWYIWLSAGNYTRLGPLTQFHVGSADIPVPGDYDLDGKADPAVYESAAGAWYLWLSGNGYAPLGPVTFTTTDSHLAVPADYDGDAKCDPTTYIPTLGKWRMWMSGSGYNLTEMELR